MNGAAVHRSGNGAMWDQSAAENGGMAAAENGFAMPRAKHLKAKGKGNNTLRLLLVAIAALLFAAVLLYAVLARNKPGLDPLHGLHMGDHQGKLKGFPKIRRIVQRRGLTSQREDYHGDLGPDHHHDGHHEEHHGEHHEDHHIGEHDVQYEDGVQTITKEMDLEHLEHAGFDPEAAAFEDGNDVEDLGYDQDIESEFDEVDEHGITHSHQPSDEWHEDHAALHDEHHGHHDDHDTHHGDHHEEDHHDPHHQEHHEDHHDPHHQEHHEDHSLHHEDHLGDHHEDPNDPHHEDHHADHHGDHHEGQRYGHHGEHVVRHDAEHGGEVHDGRHIGGSGAHARNLHNVHSGHHVGDDSSLHMGEDHFKPHHGSPRPQRGQGAHGSHDAHEAHDAHGHGHGHEAPEHGRHAGVPADQQHHGGSHEGHEEDHHDKEHKIKVRARLAEIFPKIDTNHDMHIDQAEMLAWHDANGRNTSARRAKREFTWADTNGDGQVTLAEYLADLMPASFKGNESLAEIEASPVWKDPAHEWVLHNKATFLLADEDRSGGLSEREHFSFSHPEDSTNAALHAHLRRQDIIDRDRNHDNKLDFDEFHDALWYTLHEWEHPNAEPEADDHIVSSARFHELDVNHDNHLDADELAPVFHLLHPGEHEYARMQAMHQMTAADNSGDGRLTLSEMVANPYVFYGSSVVDEEDEAPVHDEF